MSRKGSHEREARQDSAVAGEFAVQSKTRMSLTRLAVENANSSSIKSQLPDYRCSRPFPFVFKMCILAHVSDERGPEARDALATGPPNAPI
jgi:hypothetical protein